MEIYIRALWECPTYKLNPVQRMKEIWKYVENEN